MSILPDSLYIFLTLCLLTGEQPAASHIQTTAHIIEGDIVCRNLHISLLQDVDSLLVLAVGDELEGCLGEQATVGIAHTHGSLVDIESLLLQVTELESGHDVVIGLLCIEVLRTWLVGGEWSDTVGKTLLYEVVAKVHIVLLSHGKSHVDRTCPVAL